MLDMLYKVQKKGAPVPSPLVTISEAAALLGVSLPTLRRWDAAGKFEARRHPMNGYRLYRRADILKLKGADQERWGMSKTKRAPAPKVGAPAPQPARKFAKRAQSVGMPANEALARAIGLLVRSVILKGEGAVPDECTAFLADFVAVAEAARKPLEKLEQYKVSLRQRELLAALYRGLRPDGSSGPPPADVVKWDDHPSWPSDQVECVLYCLDIPDPDDENDERVTPANLERLKSLKAAAESRRLTRKQVSAEAQGPKQQASRTIQIVLQGPAQRTLANLQKDASGVRQRGTAASYLVWGAPPVPAELREFAKEVRRLSSTPR
jgi:excisionase family DNA binding protein